MATVFEQKPSTKLRALVVDDSQIARYVLSDMLERLGLEVEVADSAETGLQTLRETPPERPFSVVFMDYLLPGIDGLEAARRLSARDTTADIPIVMYTSEDSPEFRRRAEDAGSADIFVKTARQDALQRILARLGIVSAAAKPAESTDNVVAMRSAPTTASTSSGAGANALKLLSRSVESHHATLRSDLLAEFAILERHEEKIRAELVARVNLVARHTVGQLKKAAEESARERAEYRREASRRAWAHAATFLLAIGLTLGVAWKAIDRYASLETQIAAAGTALESQSRTIEALQAELAEARIPAAGDAPRATPILTAQQPFESLPGAVGTTPSAATSLVGEMQSMGILGKIRIETDAGTFCVRAAPGGYRIEGGNPSFNDCESLPIFSQTTP